MQRAALIFHYLDGLNVHEIAGLLGRSDTAVESLLARAGAASAGRTRGSPMTEDRLDGLMQQLDRPVAPDPGYADRAFAELAAVAGFRSGGRTGRWPMSWLGLALRDTTRLAWIVIAVVLLGAFVAGIVAVGSQQPRPHLGRADPTANAVAPGPAQSPSATAAPSTSSQPTASIFRPGSDVLAIGRKAPDWTGRLLDGGAFSTDGLSGRPAALLIWCTCVGGPQVRTFLEAARSRDDVELVLISLDSEGTTRGLVGWVGARRRWYST